MSFFLTNVCKYSGCGLIFPTLAELIQHIESTHIDFSTEKLEELESEKSASMPLSYILSYSSDGTKVEDSSSSSSLALSPKSTEKKNDVVQKNNRNHSFLNGIDSDSETYDLDLGNLNDLNDNADIDADDSFCTEFIMRYGSRSSDDNHEKPFACPVPGCSKRYKHVNGIKYHAKNGHKKKGRANKEHKCHCGKMYKTAQGLKNHVFTAHNSSEVMSPNTKVSESLGLMSLMPNNFDGLYENGYGFVQQPINNLNVGTFSNMEMQTDIFAANPFTAWEGSAGTSAATSNMNMTSAIFVSNPSTFPEEKPTTSRSAANLTNLECMKQNDDIIDVGDATDCIYQYFT